MCLNDFVLSYASPGLRSGRVHDFVALKEYMINKDFKKENHKKILLLTSLPHDPEFNDPEK